MEEHFINRAQSYASTCNEEALLNHEIRAKSPVLFVVLGEYAKSGIDTIQKTLSRNVMNAEGVVYLHIALEEAKHTSSNDTNEVSLSLPLSCLDKERKRGELPKSLLSNDKALKLLNNKLQEVRAKILEKSKFFHHWEQVHVFFITAGSEAINVLLPDITVLLRKKLEQDFKQINMDLFVLIEEASGMATPLNQAMTISLFKELECYQKDTYHYEKAVELLDDDLKMTLHYNQPLFQMVFIMSDKKENGQKIDEAAQRHYETIATVSLLKNKQQKQLELVEARQQYNNNIFINNVRYKGQERYATASLAKVKKPSIGIYLAVGYHLFEAYIKQLKGEDVQDTVALLEIAGLSEKGLSLLVEESMPHEENLSEIHSMISQNATFKDIKNSTFKETEQLLYKRSLEAFFEDNFVKVSERKLEENSDITRIKQRIYQDIVCQIKYGPYALEALFQKEALEEVDKLRKRYLFEEKQLMETLEKVSGQIVGERIASRVSFFDKKYLREVKDYLVNEIYTLKYQCLAIKLKLRAIDYIKDSLEALYEEIKQDIKNLEQVGVLLKGLMEESNKFEETYLVQNVNEYYQKIVQHKIAHLEKTRGQYFLQEDKFMGSVKAVFRQSKEQILEKLYTIEEKYILQDEKLFRLSFEEELLARANMLINYEEKEVVAKGELYDMLYLSLEENSKPCVFLDTASLEHRYEEKYFFGDRESEFMSYAYERDQSTRNYKLAYMSDARKNSIEKLQLMGGFRLSDLVFTTTAQRYYDAYVKEGYIFHSDLE